MELHVEFFVADHPRAMTDFRLADPDGYYIRVTAPPAE